MRVLAVFTHRRTARDEDEPKRRPDGTVPWTIAAFCLGVVVAAVTVLGIQATRPDTVPATTHRIATERAAAAEASAGARLAALDGAEALTRRLVAALEDAAAAPASVSVEDLAQLRRDVARQTERVETVRIVRVPVPTAAPTRAPAPQRPPTAVRPSPQPAPSPTPAPPAPDRCVVALFGTCLAR